MKWQQSASKWVDEQFASSLIFTKELIFVLPCNDKAKMLGIYGNPVRSNAASNFRYMILFDYLEVRVVG
jgi:hypothetical protein